jgi:DNA-binding Lrp family transcriptional regulator
MDNISAVILMKVERGKVDEVARRLLALNGVSEVFSVAGQYDVVAIVRTTSNQQIAELITVQMNEIPHIQHTETLMTFKAFVR